MELNTLKARLYISFLVFIIIIGICESLFVSSIVTITVFFTPKVMNQDYIYIYDDVKM